MFNRSASLSLGFGWWKRVARHFPTDNGVVRLRQRRIFVLPTKRGWGFLLTVGLMLLMSLNYAVSLGFVITFLWLGVMASALIQTFRNLWGLEIAPLTAGHAFAGGALKFTVMLRSGREMRERIALSLDQEEPEILTMQVDDTRSVALTRSTTRRGYLPMGRLRIESEAPLGLWYAWSYVHFPLRGIVFPAPEVAPPPLPQDTDPNAGNASAGRSGNEDFAGLREYQYGDPIQRIAWKAVARGGGWFTKAFEGTEGRHYVHLNYAQMPVLLSVEARLSRLTAWILTCQREGLPFALTLPTAVLPWASGSEHEHAALTALALFPDHILASSEEGRQP